MFTMYSSQLMLATTNFPTLKMKPRLGPMTLKTEREKLYLEYNETNVTNPKLKTEVLPDLICQPAVDRNIYSSVPGLSCRSNAKFVVCIWATKATGKLFYPRTSSETLVVKDQRSVKVGVLCPVQEPGSYWDRSAALPLSGVGEVYTDIILQQQT